MEKMVLTIADKGGVFATFQDGSSVVASENEKDLTGLVQMIADYLTGCYSNVYVRKRLQVKSIATQDWEG